jgi:hypothetical protein
MELRLNQTARNLRLYSEESNLITRKTSKKRASTKFTARSETSAVLSKLRYFSGSGIKDMYYKEQVKPIKEQ